MRSICSITDKPPASTARPKAKVEHHVQTEFQTSQPDILHLLPYPSIEFREMLNRRIATVKACHPFMLKGIIAKKEAVGLSTTPGPPRQPGFAIFGRRSHGRWLGWSLHGRRRNRLRRLLDRRTLRFITDRRVTYRLRLARLSSHCQTPYHAAHR